MERPPCPQNEERMERLVGNLLRGGVLLAAALVALGGVLFLIRFGHQPADHGTFHGEPAELRSVPGILQAAFGLSRRGMIQLGILVLIATPVARVVVSMFLFLRERDFQYVLFTLIVLAGLLYSLVGGLH